MDRAGLLSVVEDSVSLKRAFFDRAADDVVAAAAIMSEALAAERKILIFGNGGSASDAQHFSSELVNRFVGDRRALAALALTTDSSVVTSIANDSHFDEVFSRQIEALGKEGDVAVAISTSGNSENVLRAVLVARDKGMRTVGLAGRDGGKLEGAVDLCLTVPHEETARIQEVHAMIVHLFCQLIEDALFT